MEYEKQKPYPDIEPVSTQYPSGPPPYAPSQMPAGQPLQQPPYPGAPPPDTYPPYPAAAPGTYPGYPAAAPGTYSAYPAAVPGNYPPGQPMVYSYQSPGQYPAGGGQPASIVVVAAVPQQPVIEIPFVSMIGAIVLSCFVFWCCGCLFGGVAFIIALVGQNAASAGNSQGAIQLRNASYGVSIAGIIIGIISIVIFVTMPRYHRY